MSKRAGSLLFNRIRQTIPGGLTDIDTGITVPSRAFVDGQPTLGVEDTAAPAAGEEPASALMVIPLPPLSAWTDIDISGEPYFNTDTQTMHVEFSNGGKGGVEINVLFWLPTTSSGPGEVDTYNAP